MVADISTDFNGRAAGSSNFTIKDASSGLVAFFSAPGQIINTNVTDLSLPGSNRAWGIFGNKVQAKIEFTGAIVQNVKVHVRGTTDGTVSSELGTLQESDAFIKFLRVQPSSIEPADLLVDPVDLDNTEFVQLSVSDPIGVGSIIIKNNGPANSLALIGGIEVTVRSETALNIPATPANGCLGVDVNGEVDRKFKCLKEIDDVGNKVYTCTTKRLFYVTCPKINQLCSQFSNGYVAAITTCNQRLF